MKKYKAWKDKRYRERHPERIRAKKAAYYQRNKTKINKKANEKLKTNPQARISHSLRSRLSQCIRGIIKAGSAVRDMGCSIDELKDYLEAKFSEGMSWENYGKWHIDHIIPLCKFDLSQREEFLKACHFSNLQPLWAFENFSKNRY